MVGFLVQLNKDELISRLTGTTPNRFTPDLSFVSGSMTYILPIVGGLMVQFPAVSNAVYSVLEPILHIIH